MAYRSGEDVAQRIQRRLASIHKLLPRITPTYAALLELPHERIAEMAADVGAQDPNALEAELADIETALTEAIADAPRLTDELLHVSQALPRHALGEPWPASEVTHVDLEGYAERPVDRRFDTARLARTIDRLDPRCGHVDQHGTSYRVDALRIDEVPFALEVQGLAMTEEVEIRLVTTVARAVAPVKLVRQTWLHSITTAVKLQTDALTGDRRFDEHFLVTAHEDTAARVLDPELRRGLLRFAGFTTPELTLGDGLAELRYRYDFSEMLLDRAIDLLRSFRSREVELELLR